MAASAPIQFTVDQEALKVADSSILKERSVMKKRAPPSGNYVSSPSSAVPRPMYAKKDSDPSIANTVASNNGIPTPSTTPPPVAAAADAKQPRPVASPSKPVPFKADLEEGDSPKALPTEPVGEPQLEELKEPLDGNKTSQSEDGQEDSNEREMDIYSEAVLACKLPRENELYVQRVLTYSVGSIENPEACIMCSG